MFGSEGRIARAGRAVAPGARPLYYTEIAERFSKHDFQTVARALGHLHTTERLWQDGEGRMCERGSKFAAKPPGS